MTFQHIKSVASLVCIRAYFEMLVLVENLSPKKRSDFLKAQSKSINSLCRKEFRRCLLRTITDAVIPNYEEMVMRSPATDESDDEEIIMYTPKIHRHVNKANISINIVPMVKP